MPSTRTTEDPSKDDFSLPKGMQCILPYLVASLASSIIEDTITQLRILAECNNEIRIIKTKLDWMTLLAIKNGVKQPAITDELDGIDQKNLGCQQYKVNKLDSDRKLITNVFTAMYLDLALKMSFEALTNCVQSFVSRNKYRLHIENEEAKNKVIRKEVYRQLRSQRNHNKSTLYDVQVKITGLESQVEDSTLIVECKTRYLDNWQQARTEQHKQKIIDSESVNTEYIEYYKQRNYNEQRVHSEVELLVNIAINETLQKIEDWMTKYDKDIEAIDLRIQIKKNEYQDMKDRRVQLEKTIEDHAALIKNWVHFKDEREKARAYHEKMTNAALCVQAWWRGLLVRRELGPYKPKKKAPPPKKK